MNKPEKGLAQRMLELKEKIIANHAATHEYEKQLKEIETTFAAYIAATKPNENGIAAVSESWAKKNTLGMSEQDIMDDLLDSFIKSKNNGEQ